MINLQRVSYVRLGTRDIEGAIRFATDVLGLEVAEASKVREFIAFNDPTGNRIELVWRPAYGGARYHGTRDAGITEFSHVGLCTTDAARDEAFWTQVCNARVSDRVGDAPLLPM